MGQARKVKKIPETENPKNSAKRTDWEANHIIIYDAYVKAFNDRGRPPIQSEIAEVTGLHRDTVAAHLKSSSLSKLIPSLRPQTLLILQGLAKRAYKGYAAEVKLWLQVVESWKETTVLDVEKESRSAIVEMLQLIRK